MKASVFGPCHISCFSTYVPALVSPLPRYDGEPWTKEQRGTVADALGVPTAPLRVTLLVNLWIGHRSIHHILTAELR